MGDVVLKLFLPGSTYVISRAVALKEKNAVLQLGLGHIMPLMYQKTAAQMEEDDEYIMSVDLGTMTREQVFQCGGPWVGTADPRPRAAGLLFAYAGEPLTWVMTQPAVSVMYVVGLLTPVFQALVQLQATGKIHQDIKLDNVAVDMKAGRAWLLDAGLASASTFEEFMSPSQGSGNGLAYLFYPPEYVVRPKWKKWADVMAKVKKTEDGQGVGSAEDRLGQILRDVGEVYFDRSGAGRELRALATLLTPYGYAGPGPETMDPDFRRRFMEDMFVDASLAQAVSPAVVMSRVDVYMLGLMLLQYLARTVNHVVDDDKDRVLDLVELASDMAAPASRFRPTPREALRRFRGVMGPVGPVGSR
jgi:type III secretory pathway component EscS